MNADKSRQHQAGADEGAELLSWTARDLPSGRHQFHRERLMTQIHELRQHEPQVAEAGVANPAAEPGPTGRSLLRRLPRPSLVLPALVAAVAGAVVAVNVMTGSDGVRARS